MLVRAVQRVPLIRAAVAASLAIAVPVALSGAQQPTSPVPATHVVKRGDTLWDIAKTYLGDSFLWPEIYRLNNEVIEDPHWIYPGEVLKLPSPTAMIVAVNPPAAPAEAPRPITAAPAQTLVPVRVEQREQATSTVRLGEYVASPWVDQPGGPIGAGYIIESGDIPGIASHEKLNLQVYDPVVIAPPVGSTVAKREWYLTYRLGPFIETFGQIVIPTGVVEVTRPGEPGEASVARIVRMFGNMEKGQRLIPYDTTGAMVAGKPALVNAADAKRGNVRWILSEPVLPSLQNYVVIDLSTRDNISTGDQIEFYRPRLRRDGEPLVIPEVEIGRAQVLRVTEFGAAAIITSQEQPAIHPGTATRVRAKMP